MLEDPMKLARERGHRLAAPMPIAEGSIRLCRLCDARLVEWNGQTFGSAVERDCVGSRVA